MMTRILTATACLIFLVGSLLAAEPPLKAGNQKDSQTTAENASQKRLNQISDCVELWHAAALSGNDKVANHFEQRLFGLFENDIAADKEAAIVKNSQRSRHEYGPGDDRNAARMAQSLKEAKEAQHNREMVLTKQRLYTSMQRTDAFSNRFRLAGDYIQIMKKELGIQPPQLANQSSDSKK